MNVPTTAQQRAATWRATTGSQRHSALLNACETYLRLRGAWLLRLRGGLGQRAGVPDLLALIPAARLTVAMPYGLLVAIEGKTGSGRLSPAQVRERAALETAGALYILAHRLEDVEAALVGAGLVVPLLLQPATPYPESEDTNAYNRLFRERA